MSVKEQLLLLLVIFLLLVVVAFTVMKVDTIVRFESGLTSTDVLRRMWSKSDQILFRPVSNPLIFAVISGAGVNYTLEVIMVSVLQIFDLIGSQSPLGHMVIAGLCYALGSISAVFLYKAVGGQTQYLVLWGLVPTFLGMFLLKLWAHTAGGHPGPHGGPFEEVNPLIVAGVRAVIICVITVVSGLWALTQSHLIRAPAQGAPNQVAAFRTKDMMLAAGPLWLIAVAHAGILEKLLPGSSDHYLVRVTERVADIMMFTSCAFVAIWTTNRAVMNGDYQWHWPSLLIPGIPLFVFGVFHSLYLVFIRHTPVGVAVYTFTVNTLLCSSSGLVGAIIYLAVVALYAHRALDPGVDGQSELVEYDEDDEEDDDEFEV